MRCDVSAVTSILLAQSAASSSSSSFYHCLNMQRQVGNAVYAFPPSPASWMTSSCVLYMSKCQKPSWILPWTGVKRLGQPSDKVGPGATFTRFGAPAPSGSCGAPMLPQETLCEDGAGLPAASALLQCMGADLARLLQPPIDNRGLNARSRRHQALPV
jgi:hypothetical protein